MAKYEEDKKLGRHPNFLDAPLVNACMVYIL